jgi:hypothetical protein
MNGPDELWRKIPTGTQILPLPRSAADARREITWREVRKFAKRLDCEEHFERCQNDKNYPGAFTNYHHALWKWVLEQTPDRVIDLLNSASFNLPDSPETAALLAVEHHGYMLWRAIFVTGMKAGEGFKGRHYRYFAEHAYKASALGDNDLFEIARQHRYGTKPKSGHESARKTKYGLIVAWLGGGLCLMPSRDDQCAALRKWFDSRSTSDAIQKAQERLGLIWFPRQSDK